MAPWSPRPDQAQLLAQQHRWAPALAHFGTKADRIFPNEQRAFLLTFSLCSLRTNLGSFKLTNHGEIR